MEKIRSLTLPLHFISSIILPSIAFLNLPIFQANLHFPEETGSLLIIVISTLGIALNGVNLSSSFIQFIGILFAMYIGAYFLHKESDIRSIHRSIVFILVFINFKSLFSKNDLLPVLLKALTYSIYICFFMYLVTFIANTKEYTTIFNNKYYTPNNSIFSILIATQCSLAFSLIINTTTSNNIRKSLPTRLLILVIPAFIMLIIGGRSGWIGIIACLIFTGYCRVKSPMDRLLTGFILMIAIGVFIVLLFFYKTDSTNGRWLILKVSLNMIKENWITGVGLGRFKTVYNTYQAAYFNSHGLDGNEALLRQGFWGHSS